MAWSVDQLRNRTGQRLGTSRWFPITQAMIDTHARMVEDEQWIHIDPERAAAGPFGAPIAHGFLTLSMLSAMAYDAQPEVDGEAMSVNYGFDRLRFLAPVRAGARIRGHFTLKRVDERRPGEVTLSWAVEVEIESEPKPALAAEWINRHYLEEAP